MYLEEYMIVIPLVAIGALLITIIAYCFRYKTKFEDEKIDHARTKDLLEKVKAEKKIDKLMEIVCGYHGQWDVPKELTKLWDFWPDYPPDWYQRKKQIYIRDKRTCAKCGAAYGELHVHHIKHLSDGGSNELSNLSLLCRRCHEEIHHTTFPEKPDAFFRTIYQKGRHRRENFVDPDSFDEAIDEHDQRANDSYLYE